MQLRSSGSSRGRLMYQSRAQKRRFRNFKFCSHGKSTFGTRERVRRAQQQKHDYFISDRGRPHARREPSFVVEGSVAVSSVMFLNLADTASAVSWAAQAANATRTKSGLPTGNHNMWFFGVSLELLGTFVNVVGKQCIRYAQLSDHPIFWLVGVVLWSLVYPLFDIAALSYAPESTVFSVDGMIVVWNVVLAPHVLGEPVTRSKLYGSAVVTIGTIGAGAFGSHQESASNTAEYMALLTTPSALFYYVLFVGLVGYGVVLQRRLDPNSRLGGLVQGVLAGWCGGCAFFLKVLIEFVREGAWSSGWAWIFLLATCGYQLAAVVLLSIAMRRHEAMFLIPIYEGTLVLNGSIAGYLVMRDYASESTLSSVIYWCWIMVILTGLYLLVWWPAHRLGDGDEPVPWLAWTLRPPPTKHGQEPASDPHPQPGGQPASSSSTLKAVTIDESTPLRP